MNPTELEAFLTANRIHTLTILTHINGWQLGIRALPGSPLHLPAAERADSYRVARGATLGEAFDEMVALATPGSTTIEAAIDELVAPAVSDSSADDVFA